MPVFEDLFTSFSTVIFLYVAVLDLFLDGRLVLRFHFLAAVAVFAAVQ